MRNINYRITETSGFPCVSRKTTRWWSYNIVTANTTCTECIRWYVTFHFINTSTCPLRRTHIYKTKKGDRLILKNAT